MSQCEYLEEIKRLDLSSKTLLTLQQLKMDDKFFTLLWTSLISCLFLSSIYLKYVKSIEIEHFEIS